MVWYVSNEIAHRMVPSSAQQKGESYNSDWGIIVWNPIHNMQHDWMIGG